MRVQGLLERTLDQQLRRIGSDITAAGVVVDNRTGSIIAYVGNARFNPAGRTQWVDCAAAPRSPGSTLKPFVYLRAMEAGHIIPASLLADTPLQLGGEAPRNFTRLYRGPVTAAVALAESLNTPAVRVMRLLGVREALSLLRRAGFSFLDRREEEYGDSLVLGAGEVTALELARAYTALANLGQDRPLLLRRAAPARGGAGGKRAKWSDGGIGRGAGRSEAGGRRAGGRADFPARRSGGLRQQFAAGGFSGERPSSGLALSASAQRAGGRRAATGGGANRRDPSGPAIVQAGGGFSHRGYFEGPR